LKSRELGRNDLLNNRYKKKFSQKELFHNLRKPGAGQGTAGAVSGFPGAFVFFAVLCLAAACSTAPRRPAETFDLRDMAEAQLDLANKEADKGNYETALLLLDDARRIAVSADDPSLRIRTGLSRGNVLFSLGRGEEASLFWTAALAEAESLGSRELSALSRIHIARGAVLSAGEEGGIAPSLREEIGRDLGLIKSDDFYVAFCWVVAGLADKALGRLGDAEASIKKALAIHERGRYLEQAAYDWFLIASIRSRTGRYPEAREALNSALALDRRAENSWGLATDWRALGDVMKKEGKAGEAGTAYRRAAEIFRSLGMEDAAEETEKRQGSSGNPG
jgi:tetratricopeptide (TPR) repeat protein